MSTNVIQTAFSTGELSPSLFARVDLKQYHVGAAKMRNFFVDYRSGASTRPGTRFLNQAFKSASPVRVIPFQTSVLIPFIIEFGDFYVRFFSNGQAVTEAAFAITGASQSNPCQLNIPGNNFNPGDWIFVQNVGGMTPLNSLFFLVTAVAGALVNIATVNGVPINSLGFPAYTSGGTAARVYTLPSPYAAADLALLKYVQQTNTMYLTHPSYPPTTLTQISASNWAFATMVFATTISAPTGLSAVATAAGGAFFAYVVTAVDANGQESLPSTPVQTASVVNITTTAGSITVSWAAVPGAVSYNVYRAELSIAGFTPSGAAFGFQGFASNTIFIDSNIVPDFSQTPPIQGNPFAGGNNPGTACFFQQRLYFGGSNGFPQTFWAGQPGLPTNFNTTNPVQDDDAITSTLVSKQVNAIKSMLPMPGGLVIFTAQGAWQVSSGQGVASTSAVTPINETANPQSYNGATDLPPIPVNFDVLYAQTDGAVIDLNYNIYAAIYTGSDISVISNHLFLGFSLKEWAFAQKPFKIIWAVRSDGALLSLTYVKEQEMAGWAQHDTLGAFQSVATVTEGQYDAIYVVVKRLLGGQFVQTIERFDDRVTFPYGAEDAWAVDCGERSTQPTPAANLTASSSQLGPATFTADASVFGSALPGDVIRMGGGIASITTVSGPTVVQANITQAITSTIPNDDLLTPFPAASGQWSLTRPSTVFTGLDYLNGQTVQILADGNVVSPQQVVAGQITLAQPATKVLAGLKFVGQLQTMPLDLGNEKDTVQAKRKKINALSLRVRQTRGLKFGNTFSRLFPIKEMNPSVLMGQAIPLVTGDERVVMDPLWSVPGQMCIQKDDPLPATILGVIPEITVGDTKDAMP